LGPVEPNEAQVRRLFRALLPRRAADRGRWRGGCARLLETIHVHRAISHDPRAASSLRPTPIAKRRYAALPGTMSSAANWTPRPS
jgi:hypothetical protein